MIQLEHLMETKFSKWILEWARLKDRGLSPAAFQWRKTFAALGFRLGNNEGYTTPTLRALRELGL